MYLERFPRTALTVTYLPFSACCGGGRDLTFVVVPPRITGGFPVLRGARSRARHDGGARLWGPVIHERPGEGDNGVKLASMLAQLLICRRWSPRAISENDPKKRRGNPAPPARIQTQHILVCVFGALPRYQVCEGVRTGGAVVRPTQDIARLFLPLI